VRCNGGEEEVLPSRTTYGCGAQFTLGTTKDQMGQSRFVLAQAPLAESTMVWMFLGLLLLLLLALTAVGAT
jgi:hypothetical protein